MHTKVYKTFAKIFGILCLVVGIGALSGGLFAGNFIEKQLSAQGITMPTEEALTAQLEKGRLTQEDVDALMPYQGQTMTNGWQAHAFSDHYIAAHIKATAAQLGYPDATYATVGSEFEKVRSALVEDLQARNSEADATTLENMADAEIANPLTEYPNAQKAAELKSLRYDTFLDGSTLRGMLLNAYGWGIVGTIALWAGIALILVGALLAVWGFVPAKK